jgi:hypothetical protein
MMQMVGHVPQLAGYYVEEVQLMLLPVLGQTTILQDLLKQPEPAH